MPTFRSLLKDFLVETSGLSETLAAVAVSGNLQGVNADVELSPDLAAQVREEFLKNKNKMVASLEHSFKQGAEKARRRALKKGRAKHK